ncbi:FAD-dependent thymidylate synthase [Anoxybacterium hadale]|uniref:FAD-dependent thymidylate synthase n=1 Tax=Anoxybacterium hadale TaxID=3408580 RepID=A0ACD1AAH4_9FIRM|nr:FAD-dependent thymidylate synthase [Clostridiales bacterium]
MKIIEASFEILDEIDGKKILRSIEKIGRVCYKSEEKIVIDSAEGFISKILRSGHESVIEHEKISVRIICDRGISHEIVRHRIASYSQESTRYCNYHNDKFGNELTFIKPYYWVDEFEKYELWVGTMHQIENTYNSLIQLGAKPEEARCVLPNSLKTEIIVSMNLREWRHFFSLRTSKRAHPQMREITIPLLEKMKELIPVVFEDITIDS